MKILVVEDSRTQALVLRRLLEEKEYEVDVAYDGTEALKRLPESRPQMVISDVVMPEMDGYELCTRIKADDEFCRIPVLLLTALSEPEDIFRGLASGADNFVTKPYDRELLLSRIEYILVNREIRRSSNAGVGFEIFFAGEKQYINSDRFQILDLLLSTYEDALRQKRKLELTNMKLQRALDQIKTLEGIIPICARCKRVRDDHGYWQQVEGYIRERSAADFSHGICPDCFTDLYPGRTCAGTEPEPEPAK